MNGRALTRGITGENPIFVLLIGLCPALAVTTTVINALTMGVAVLGVMLVSSVSLSLLRGTLPPTTSPYSELMVIAVFVTLVQLLLGRVAPVVSGELGIYLPLIAVNCIILNQAKVSALRRAPGDAAFDATSVGIGFLLSLVLIALVREVLGFGTITLVPMGSFRGVIRVPGIEESPARVVVLSAGAFIVVGYLMALVNLLGNRLKKGAKLGATYYNK